MPSPDSYLVHATPETVDLPDYADSDVDVKLDQVNHADDDKLMLSPPSPTEYRPFERAYRNFGEAALDSEDEPQTESDDDADRLAQLRNGRASSGSGDERATEFGDFLQHFPRRGAMPAEVNQVNQDASRLQLESASSSQDTEDLFVEESGAAGRGVDQLKLEPDSVELTASLGMGSSADEMAHDPAFLFKPLVAYFDSKEGAVLNGLAASGKADGIQVKADSECVPLSPSLFRAMLLTRAPADAHTSDQAREGAPRCVLAPPAPRSRHARADPLLLLSRAQSS